MFYSFHEESDHIEYLNVGRHPLRGFIAACRPDPHPLPILPPHLQVCTCSCRTHAHMPSRSLASTHCPHWLTTLFQHQRTACASYARTSVLMPRSIIACVLKLLPVLLPASLSLHLAVNRVTCAAVTPALWSVHKRTSAWGIAGTHTTQAHHWVSCKIERRSYFLIQTCLHDARSIVLMQQAVPSMSGPDFERLATLHELKNWLGFYLVI